MKTFINNTILFYLWIINKLCLLQDFNSKLVSISLGFLLKKLMKQVLLLKGIRYFVRLFGDLNNFN